MLNDKRKLWLPGAVALAFVAVALFGIFTYRNTLAIRQGERRVIQSYAVREATHLLLSAVKDMETGQRGYLLTGRAAYLEPYRAGIRHLQQSFNDLRVLTAENPSQQSHLDSLEKHVDEKQQQLAEAIALRSREPALRISDDVLALLNTDRGKVAMDQARADVEAILAVEDEVFEQNEKECESLAIQSRTSVTLGNLIALGLLAAVGLIAHLDRRRRDLAEATLQAKQSELSAIIDSAYDGIVTFGDDLHIRLLNPAAAAMYRADRQDLVGRSLLDCVPTQLSEAFGQELRDFLASHESSRIFQEAVARRSDGSEFPCHGTLAKCAINGESIGTLTLKDLTEVKASQSQSRHLSAILGQVRDAIVFCDLDGKVLSWNNGAQLMYGKSESEVLGRHIQELLFVGRRELWEKGHSVMLVTGVFWEEVLQKDCNGQEIVVEHRQSLIRDEGGLPTGQLILNIDITERKRKEAIERRSQRLETIGILAGGVAHDLNNVLTPILMSAKLVKRGSSNAERLLETIVLSAERGGRMIKKLLAFAGGDKSIQQQICLRDIILDAEEILSHTLPKTIDLRVTAPENVLPILGDPTELSQVIMNLAINSRDAMPDGGRLEIEISNFGVDASRANRSDNLQPGPHVLLTVADTGHGIPTEIGDRVFDPFFTTKPQGKGTGLGLATTLGIVRSCGGDVDVYSEPGVGTTFSIYLPASKVPAGLVADSEELGEVPTGNGEKIMVVDDEPLILEAARETLETSGYRVLTAASGSEAVTTYQNRSEEIDMVLLDMMMPGMNGVETKQCLRELDPGVSIVASSGLRRPGAEGGKLADVDGFLAKPYSDEQLLRTIHKVLNIKNMRK